MGNTKSFLVLQDQNKTPRRPFAPWNNNKRTLCISSKLFLHQPTAKLMTKSKPSPLQDLILLRDWQRVLCRVKLFPEELRSYFRFQISPDHTIKILPLHLVCALEPPLAVVEVMLEHYIDASALPIIPAKKKKKKKNRMRIRYGKSPNQGPAIVPLDELGDAHQSLLEPASIFPTASSKSVSTKEGWGSADADPDGASQCSSISSYDNRTNKSVILQLSPTGSIHPMPVRTDTADTSSETTSGSLFCVQWNWNPLFQHVMEEGNLLPLHIACFYSASADIVQALANAYPAAALCDVMGMLPIHWLAAGWNLSATSPLDSLIVLKRIVPDSVRIRSGSHGMTPSEYLNECMEECNTKESCLWAVEEVDDDDLSSDASLIFGSSDDDDSTAGVARDDTAVVTTSPTTCMGRLLEECDWEALSAAVAQEPGLAQQWIYGLDNEGPCVWKRLPLHVACAYGAPLGLILMLVQAFPDGLGATDPRDGSNPLHICCESKAPLPIVRLLLVHCQESVLVCNRLGRLPLHVAVLAKASYGIIEALVEEYPGTVLTKDADGKSAVDYAMTMYDQKQSVYGLLIGLATMLNDYLTTDTPSDFVNE